MVQSLFAVHLVQLEFGWVTTELDCTVGVTTEGRNSCCHDGKMWMFLDNACCLLFLRECIRVFHSLPRETFLPSSCLDAGCFLYDPVQAPARNFRCSEWLRSPPHPLMKPGKWAILGNELPLAQDIHISTYHHLSLWLAKHPHTIAYNWHISSCLSLLPLTWTRQDTRWRSTEHINTTQCSNPKADHCLKFIVVWIDSSDSHV